MTATKTKAKKADPTPERVSTVCGTTLDGKYELIPLDSIKLDGKKDRQGKTDEQLNIHELADSIATAGLVQPIDVVRLPDASNHLVCGERRYRAHRHLKRELIPAIVHDAPALTDDIVWRIAKSRAVENVQRLDPSPIGEAIAIADLFEIELDFVCSAKGPNDPKSFSVPLMAVCRTEAIEAVARQIGKPVAWVRDRMFLSGFSGKARDLVSAGRLPLLHAKEIAKVADPKRRDELAEEYAIASPGKHGYYRNGEGRAGDIEDLRREVAKVCFSLGQVPWRISEPFDGKPACLECPHNSLNNPGLFEGKALFADDHKSANKVGRHDGPDSRPEPNSGICLKPACYQEKAAAAGKAISTAATRVIKQHEASKAAKEKGAASLLGLGAIKQVIGDATFLSPFAVKERVESRLEARKPSKKSASRSSGYKPAPGDYGSPEYAAVQKARTEYQRLQHHWQDKVAVPLMDGYLSKVPGRWVMWSLVRRTKPFEKAVSYNAKQKDFESPELLRLLRLMDVPSMENALEIQKSCGVRFGLFSGERGEGMSDAFIATVLRALGLKIEDPPVFEAMRKAAIDAFHAKGDKAKPAKKGVVTVGEDLPEDEE